MARLPHWEFQRLHTAHSTTPIRRGALSPWDHFLALAFAQMTFRESLRDIEACLEAQTGLAYHMGFRARITRSTLARANEERDWRPLAALAQKLMPRVRALYRDEPNAIELDAPIYAVSAALIAELYRHRWQIELFFRWLKHGLRMRSFTAPAPMPCATNCGPPSRNSHAIPKSALPATSRYPGPRSPPGYPARWCLRLRTEAFPRMGRRDNLYLINGYFIGEKIKRRVNAPLLHRRARMRGEKVGGWARKGHKGRRKRACEIQHSNQKGVLSDVQKGYF